MNHECPIYIIVAVLNAQKNIERCLQSIFNQDYPDLNLIVVDGGSTDGTVAIVEKYQAGLTWWISEPDHGIYDAWNKALAQIDEGWILFLGADDTLYSSDVLSRAVESLQLVPSGTKVAYGQISVVDGCSRTLARKGEPWSVAGKHFTSTMTLPHQSIFHHSSIFRDFGDFNSAMKIAGDYDLLLRVLPHSPPLFLNNLIVATWEIGGVSYDVKTPLLVAREFSLARRLNGFHAFSLALMVFYIKAYILRGLYLVLGYRFASWFAKTYRTLTGQWR